MRILIHDSHIWPLYCEAHTEVRDTDVFLLKFKQAGSPGLKPGQWGGQLGDSFSGSRTSANSSMRSGMIAIQNQPIPVFIRNIQPFIDKPVVDQTGLTGNFDFALDIVSETGSSETDAIKQALSAQLGLELVPSRESLDLLLVQKLN